MLDYRLKKNKLFNTTGAATSVLMLCHCVLATFASNGQQTAANHIIMMTNAQYYCTSLITACVMLTYFIVCTSYSELLYAECSVEPFSICRNFICLI